MTVGRLLSSLDINEKFIIQLSSVLYSGSIYLGNEYSEPNECYRIQAMNIISSTLLELAPPK